MCILSINLMVFDDSGGSFSLLVKPSGPCSSDEFGILRSRSDEIVNPINSATFFLSVQKQKVWTKTKGPGLHGFGWPAGPLRPSRRPKVGSQKSSFSTGFIRFSDMAECHVVYSENLMLFDHFGGHFAFWAPK